MAKLSGTRILTEVSAGRITIDPLVPHNVGPNSVDLTLSPTLLQYEDPTLDMRKAPKTRELQIPEEGLVLVPGQLYLGMTNEVAGSDKYVPCIEGRSSVARLGLAVHITAGFGDVGWINRWTLEMIAFYPIRIYAGARVCQVYFDTVEGAVIPYAGKYSARSSRPAASRLFEDFKP